ncbi:MAG: delta-class carbonic anhydrase [Henriciella sp.]|uniref:delta-class carbonic anhydrase n=1 Tax=Henriciella sp. TaxID=1968823 RepID=UPI003C773672
MITTYKSLMAAATASSALLLSGCANETVTSETIADTAVQAETVEQAGLCLDAGPQTPRDIASTYGLNSVSFDAAPPPGEMNLCNIHTHTNAEHKGPGFSVFVNDSDFGGFACNATEDLTATELAPVEGAYGNVQPGDTIEVHWVHTTCDTAPGEGLGACVPETCSDPLLRVEAQVFLVVNDGSAADFTELAAVRQSGGVWQPGAIPASTGEPVTFQGSTTGPSYTEQQCSPAKVTWSVRPQCTKVDINSLHAWAEKGNVFNETKSHGVRQLVTAPELLSPIE